MSDQMVMPHGRSEWCSYTGAIQADRKFNGSADVDWGGPCPVCGRSHLSRDYRTGTALRHTTVGGVYGG